MSDQFFEEEEELARTEAAARRAPKPQKTPRPAARATAAPAPASGPKPPSFALVVAIAVVALLVGVCLGYFFAMSIVDDDSIQQNATASLPSASTGDDASAGEAATSSGASMPADHPDISSFINPDGSVNQAALDAYKAERAAAQGASAASADADSVESGSEG